MAARKSVLYFNSVLPVTESHDDVVRKRLKPGKFVFTVTGGVKIAGAICLLVGEALGVASSFCRGDDSLKYAYIALVALTIVCTIASYMIFASGVTVRKPEVFVKADIISCLVLSTATIIASSICTSKCVSTDDTFYNVSGPLGIAGGIVLVISCASMFLMYRYREEDDVDVDKIRRKPPPPRKSVFA